jgi:hypothetical protein
MCYRIVKKEEAKPAAKPSVDDSLMKKKLERDAQNSALNALLQLQTRVCGLDLHPALMRLII